MDWSFGLVNTDNKYLTAEKFMGKVGCTTAKFGIKQIWFLENKGDDSGAVAFRGNTGKYLAVHDEDNGKVDGTAEQGDEKSFFLIEAQPDGRWLIKSQKSGKYLGGSGESLTCFITEAAADRYWSVHLAMHPQAAIRGVKSKKYWGLAESGGAPIIQCKQDLPWGDDATINVIPHVGTVQFQAANGGYFHPDGSLGDDDADTHFTVDFKDSEVAFKSTTKNHYISVLNPSSPIKCPTKSSAGPDERFVMEDSWPQVSFKSVKVGKYMSRKGGVEIAANATTVTDEEIFQLEPQADDTWLIKSSITREFAHGEFMQAEDGSINASGGDAGVEPLDINKFQIEFVGDSKVAIKHGGMYVKQKMNKQFALAGTEVNEDTTFVMEIVNRPTLALRGKYGFVGLLDSGMAKCNSSGATMFSMTHNGAGYTITGWKTAGDGTVTGNIAGSDEVYEIQLLKESKMAISYNGKFLCGKQTGEVEFTGDAINEATSWEY